METFIVTNSDGTETEWVLIQKGDGEFTSMSKAIYDEMKANEATSKQSS